MRRWLLAGWLAGAVVLFIVAIGAGLTDRANALSSERSTLAQQAAVESQALEGYFSHPRGLIELTARNPAFADFYSLPGNQKQRARSTGVTMDRIADALAYLGRMCPDQIGRASFVDTSGAENVRVVSGQPIRPEELTSQWGNAEYFTPTLALPHGVVYQSKPYLSKELSELVISSGTQVATPDRVKHAMVHFEVPLSSIPRLTAAYAPGQLLVVDADTGNVVIDVSSEQRRAAHDEPDRRFAALTARWSGNGMFTIDDRQAAYHTVPAEVGNANRWYVVAVAPESVTTLGGIGGLPIAVALVSLLVIAYLVASVLRAQSALLSAAHTDPLTGLYNRRQLVSDLNTLVPRARQDQPLLLIVSDLNGFKAYNDTFGHPEGDRLLVRLAGALSAVVDGRGKAYRIGGDEFCVLALPGRNEIDNLIEAVTLALCDERHDVRVTGSVGAIVLPDETTDANEAVLMADRRMYGRKRNRRAGDRPTATDSPTTTDSPITTDSPVTAGPPAQPVSRRSGDARRDTAWNDTDPLITRSYPVKWYRRRRSARTP